MNETEAVEEKAKKKISTTEKYFWGTILILFVVYLGLQIVVYTKVKSTDTNTTKNTPIIKGITDKIEILIVQDERIHNNLNDEKVKEAIETDLEQRVGSLYADIDKNVDMLFDPVYGSIDSFLDFHYSVIGEYSELGAAVTGEIEKTIQDKLFGRNFSYSLELVTMNMQQKFMRELDVYQESISSKATEGIDRELNSEILNNLKADIEKNISFQGNKIAAFLGVGVGYKVIVGSLGKKIASSLGSKLAVKGAVKAGTKMSAAGTGAAAGALCGPGVVICAPILAIAAWFGTDAVLIAGDEYLHRDEFKSEIIRSIDTQKSTLKQQYKEIYLQAFNKVSSQIVQEYRELPAQKQVRKKVKEYIGE